MLNTWFYNLQQSNNKHCYTKSPTIQDSHVLMPFILFEFKLYEETNLTYFSES